MHGLAQVVVASERERQITYTAADMGARQILADPSGGTDEIECIDIVLLNARSDGEDVRVEDNVVG